MGKGDRHPAWLMIGVAGAALFCALFILDCSSVRKGKAILGPSACDLLDSLYLRSGFEAGVAMAGKATFDVEQYRLRGQFNLMTTPGGEIGFEYSSSSLFGSHREDISLSVRGGVLRVLDRERGKYYEGEEVDWILRETFGVEVDAGEIVTMVLGSPISCSSVKKPKIGVSGSGGASFSALFAEELVRVEFKEENGKLEALQWPIRFARGEVDRLRAEYTWDSSGTDSILDELVLTIPARGWRIKLNNNL